MSDRPHPETVEPPVAGPASAGQIRRLDHVAIVIRNTDVALGHFRDKLGLTVVHSEELEQPRVRLTYLDAGNALIQLVEPLDDASDAAHSLNEHGEGIHHICFAVDDVVLPDTRELSRTAPPSAPGQAVEECRHSSLALPRMGCVSNARSSDGTRTSMTSPAGSRALEPAEAESRRSGRGVFDSMRVGETTKV